MVDLGVLERGRVCSITCLGFSGFSHTMYALMWGPCERLTTF